MKGCSFQTFLGLVTFREKCGIQASRKTKAILGLKRKTQLAVFSRELALLLQAGLTIQDALGVLIESHSDFGEALSVVQRSLSQGRKLSEALLAQSHIFGKVYGRSVALAEETGSLVAVFVRLADWQEKEMRILSKATQALIYPAFVILVSVIGALVFALSCLPLFTEVLQELGGTLPLPTQLLIGTVRTLTHPVAWFVVLLALGLWALYLRSWLQSDDGRHDFEMLLRSLPVVGVLIRDLSLARIFASLRLTNLVGLNLAKGFRASAEASGSRVLVRDAKELTSAIMEGMPVHQYLETRPEFYPRDVVGLMCVGEESGGLDRCFSALSDYYEREVEYRVAAFLAMLEPLVTGLVSLFVGVIILALMLPLASVIRQL